MANMGAASSSAAGTAGLVPAPAAGDENKQLLGSGTFAHTSPFNLTGKNSLFTYHTVNCCLPFQGSNTGNLSNNTIYFSPIFLGYPFSFDTILFRNASGNAQTNSKFGLYTHDRTNGLPKNIVVQSSNIASIAGTTAAEISVSLTSLNPDLYWACFVCNSSSPNTRAGNENNGFKFSPLLIGGANSANLANWALNSYDFATFISYSFTYTGSESLPSSLSASSISLTNGIYLPFMAIRKS